MTASVPATIVNHVSLEIPAPPDAVWAAIQEEYVEARKFSGAGSIEPFDDPAAVRAYRMRVVQGEVVDEREVRITERDHAARRLSAYADYQTVPASGMGVWATYHAQEVPGEARRTRYAIDCHARLRVDVPDGAGTPEVQAAIAAMKAAFDTALLAYLERFRAQFEPGA
ncbi:hypothetical protein [Mitsuaria sp. GD03876]|uniref:hypothetical protein n=1 Tax=Mitsuaria sp. GD03876 TaxID=2975399 RepID=UPI00244BBB10|nr:hypothetical protein [Mitsuaria sp. GD03876]MDH0866506.1 hypothetical protein [Mitsuaria sp. GD03876]